MHSTFRFATQTSGRILRCVCRHEARLPPLQAMLFALHKLLAGGRIIQAMFPHLQSAARNLSVLLARADFLPFSTTLFAILARLQVFLKPPCVMLGPSLISLSCPCIWLSGSCSGCCSYCHNSAGCSAEAELLKAPLSVTFLTCLSLACFVFLPMTSHHSPFCILSSLQYVFIGALCRTAPCMLAKSVCGLVNLASAAALPGGGCCCCVSLHAPSAAVKLALI